jgi:nucleoside-diphosphate-sugar epimerase
VRCLIAGCGYVGTALGVELAAAGHEVFALRRRPQGLPAPLRPLAADLADPETLAGLPAGIEGVIYTAAAGGRSEAAYRAAYLDGLRNLIERLAAADPPPRRLLYASSTSVYGQQDGRWVDEDSATEPGDFSGRLVLAGERALAEGPIPATAVRFGGIYGPGRTRLTESVRSGSARVAAGPPRWTNRIHRDDAAGALGHLLLHPDPAPVYVAVDCEPATQRDVYDWLAKRLGTAAPLDAPLDGTASPRRASSNKRCRNARLLASGYAFRYPSFREGYAALLAEPS